MLGSFIHKLQNYMTQINSEYNIIDMMEEEPVHCLMGHQMIRKPPNSEHKCDACARSSSEASFYSCSECGIMIHRKCAKLPKQIDHPMHPKHPLFLLSKPPYQNLRKPYIDPETCRCQVCKKSWSNFVYHCSSCDFDVDVLCAFLEDDVSKIITIPAHHHPVRLVRRPAKFRCNACSVEGKDKESFICTEPSCGFWIHKKCGSLPELFKRPDHDHPLQLAIRMPHRYRKYNFTCEICQKKFGFSAWIYYCQLCKYFVHIKCIAAELPAPSNRGGDAYSLDFVIIRELKTVTEQALLPFEGFHDKEDKAHHEYLKQEDGRLPLVKKVDAHKHSLVLISDNHHHEHEVICDGCIQHIDHASSSPYYKCGQGCNFFLHATCASFPQHRHVSSFRFHADRYCRELELYFPEKPWEALKCRACGLFCGGYGYKCTISGCDFFVDIKCIYLIGVMKHIGHKHDLHFNYYAWHRYSARYECSGCGCVGVCLDCKLCKFKLGYECATLPATAAHRWDKHPLILTFPPYFRDSPDADEQFFCEVCEDEIHPKHWIYRCAECDQYFHPRCIPTLGECRNIKFGKVFHIQSHPHPLTLVPQAGLTSKCHYCRKSLNWSRAYECASCGYYLCPDCVPKEELVGE